MRDFLPLSLKVPQHRDAMEVTRGGAAPQRRDEAQRGGDLEGRVWCSLRPSRLCGATLRIGRDLNFLRGSILIPVLFVQWRPTYTTALVIYSYV
jgi:hypothetical protein